MADADKGFYGSLAAALRKILCPLVAREQYFAEFEQRTPRTNEDHSLFLWDLRQLLGKADPALTEAAWHALLSRQFMKGLSTELRIRLLEHDLTPSLNTMRDLFHRFRVIDTTSVKLQRGASIEGWVAGHPKYFLLVPHCSVLQLTTNPVSCTLGGLNVHALVDTGSMKSFISRDIFN